MYTYVMLHICIVDFLCVFFVHTHTDTYFGLIACQLLREREAGFLSSGRLGQVVCCWMSRGIGTDAADTTGTLQVNSFAGGSPPKFDTAGRLPKVVKAFPTCCSRVRFGVEGPQQS